MPDAASFSAVQQAAAPGDETSPERLAVRLTGTTGPLWAAAVHRNAGGALLEVRLPRPHTELLAAALFQRYERAAKRLRNALDARTLCRRLAEEVRALTGYDRVLPAFQRRRNDTAFPSPHCG